MGEAALCLKLAHVVLVWVMLALVPGFLTMIRAEEEEVLGKEEDPQGWHFFPEKSQAAEVVGMLGDCFRFFLESNRTRGHWSGQEMDW